MHHFKRSYEGQCDEVDRLYPALEVRRYLSASLAQAAETPMFLSMSLPMSILDRPNGIRTQNPRTRFDSEGTWTPQSVDRDLDLEKGQNHDLILDNIDDIFTLSGSSNSSPGTSTPAHRPDPNPTGSNEFELDSATSTDFDEESLYSDAMSRKASLVRIHECMLSFHTHIKLEFYYCKKIVFGNCTGLGSQKVCYFTHYETATFLSTQGKISAPKTSFL